MIVIECVELEGVRDTPAIDPHDLDGALFVRGSTAGAGRRLDHSITVPSDLETMLMSGGRLRPGPLVPLRRAAESSTDSIPDVCIAFVETQATRMRRITDALMDNSKVSNRVVRSHVATKAASSCLRGIELSAVVPPLVRSRL